MCRVLPEIVEPDLCTELVTITAMKLGSGPAGGGGLFPGSVVQLVPQTTVFGVSAKPLNAAGAAPPSRVFSFHHWAPQKVTAVPTAALPLPIAKFPPATAPKIRIVVVASAVLPPSSTMWTLIVKLPRLPYVWVPLTVNEPALPVTVPA